MKVPSPLFFQASVIAAADGVCSSTIRRRARRGKWLVRKHGDRVYFSPPRGLRRKSAALSPLPSLWDCERKLRELFRAAAVVGFCRRMRGDPTLGVERGLKETASDFRHLMKFSAQSLRRWVHAVERGGLAALQEKKRDRVGRKSSRLEAVL